MDNFFSIPRLFDDLDRRKIHSCGTVRPNRRYMSSDFGPKQLKLKRGDVRVSTREGLTAFIWKDGREVSMLTNVGPPPAEGRFCDNSNRLLKPHVVGGYNRHMGYVDNSDRMSKQLFDESTYLQVDHEIIFPLSGSNSTQQLDTVIFMWG